MEMSTFIVKALVVSRRFQQGEGSGTIKLREGFVDLSTFRIQVSIVTHTGVIKMPFTAIITSGNKQWEVLYCDALCCTVLYCTAGAGQLPGHGRHQHQARVRGDQPARGKQEVLENVMESTEYRF